VPLFYHGDVDVAVEIVDACLVGGAQCVEFTNRGDNAHGVFEGLSSHFNSDNRLILGAGSIVDAGTASLYLQLGANFIVGPTFNEDIAVLCNTRKVAYLPGCATVNEISHAEKFGVEICKYFPGTLGGPTFVKNILGPMPWTSIMPTGGVSLEEKNIREWFDAGVSVVGLGSSLITKEAVKQQDYEAITRNVKNALDWINSARKK
ncbi:MAG: bifunctional 4-hydroxy-2-oxoglutarate aldolase/2-dehydro-3-deoxy-phosphogluconate aldolase, partial [Anaerolineaceae bacterium]|nr:bifunctional 4-hydroxy-2-oxoglutarate aldolase/2-dehydro-3-deoxy-phosphogluconate aldolase [Anaerolineaceae bacterium]